MNRNPRLVFLAMFVAALACSFPGTPAGPVESITPGEPAVSPTVPTEEPTSPPTEIPLPPPVGDVLRIAYTDSGNIWVIEQDGSSHQVTMDGGASGVFISSDGARIAYLWRTAPYAHSELRSINPDGSDAAVLLRPDQLDGLYPIAEGTLGTDISEIAFIPGTHRLMFNTYLIPREVGFAKPDDLWTIDADTGVLAPFLPAGQGGDFFISPDGTRLAVITPTTLGMINVDGTSHRPNLITYPWVITYSEFLFRPQGIWTADSTVFGAVIPSEDPLLDAVSGTLWRVPADEGPATALGTISGNLYFHFWRSSALSPDLSRVAFSRRAGPTDENLTIAAPDGTGETVYATGSFDWEGWSPDSTHFAFSFGSPADLVIGAVGEAPNPLGPGIDFRWINATEYFYLAGSMGSWTLTRGAIGGPTVALVSPAGDTVSYDFTQ